MFITSYRIIIQTSGLIWLLCVYQLLALPLFPLAPAFESHQGASPIHSGWHSAEGQTKESEIQMSRQLFLFCLSLWVSLSHSFFLPSVSSCRYSFYSLYAVIFQSHQPNPLLSSVLHHPSLPLCLSLPRMPPLAPQSAETSAVSEYLPTGGCTALSLLF